MTPQEKLLREAVNEILAHPETFNQSTWHGQNWCNTTHCIAGWLQIKSGKAATRGTAKSDAQAAIGLSDGEAAWLFSPIRSLSDIYYFAHNFHSDGFDRAGYNRDGYNRDGFNRAGRKLLPFEI